MISLVHTSERRFADSVMQAVSRRTELHTVRKGDKLGKPARVVSREGARGLLAQVKSNQVKTFGQRPGTRTQQQRKSNSSSERGGRRGVAGAR